MKPYLQFVKIIICAVLIFTSLKVNSQSNIAPQATVSAFGYNLMGTDWNQIKDQNLGNCETFQCKLFTTNPTNGLEYMQWQWPISRQIRQIIIHHGQTTGNFLTGGTVQFWNGSSYVNYFTFSNLNQSNCVNTITLPNNINTSRLRIVNLVPGVGFQGDFTFREIEIIQSPLPNDIGISSIDTPTTFTPGIQNFKVTVNNFGSNQISNFNINWQVNGVLQTPIPFNLLLDSLGGNLSTNQSVSLGNFMFSNNKAYTIKVWTSSPNFVSDTIKANDTCTKHYFPELNGSYTIGKNNCDFSSITEVTTYLNRSGISGPVTFNLADSLYSNTNGEVFPIRFIKVKGMNSTNTIRIKPLLGINSRISGQTSQSIITLDNIHNFILDGRDTFSSNNKSLIISNSGTSGSACLNLLNDAISNTIQYVEFKQSSSTNSLGIINILGTILTKGNDSNQFLNNKFSSGTNGNYTIGIFAEGQNANRFNNDNLIYGNEFDGFTYNGIRISNTNSGNGGGWNISNNSFYNQTQTIHSTLWTAIHFSAQRQVESNGNRITNNFIGGSGPNLTGNPLTNNSDVTRYGIFVNSYSEQDNVISGNQIGNILFTNTVASSHFYGIYMSGGNSSIDSNTITDIYSLTMGGIYGIRVPPSNDYTISRNLISTIQINNFNSFAFIVGINCEGSSESSQKLNIIENKILGLKTNSKPNNINYTFCISGINCLSSSPNIKIIGNQIGSLDKPIINSNRITTTLQVWGIFVNAGVSLIEKNIIEGLIIDSIGINTNFNSSNKIIGIFNNSSLGGNIIRNNSISNLIQKSIALIQHSQINGIFYSGSGAAVIDSNSIFSCWSTSTYTGTNMLASIVGINFEGGGRAIIKSNIIDSLVLNSMSPIAGQVIGIYVVGSINNIIQSNLIRNIISNFSNTNPGICGIIANSPFTNQLIEKNIIYGLESKNSNSTGTILGLWSNMSGFIYDSTSIINANFIHSFSSINTGTQTWNGIQLWGGQVTCTNNLIRLGFDTLGNTNTRSVNINGIIDNGMKAEVFSNVYHNTIFIGGSPTSGSAQTTAYKRASNFTYNYQDVRNNIFVNLVTNSGSSGVNSAIDLGTLPIGKSKFNYNLLWAGNGLINNYIGIGPGFATSMTGGNGWKLISGTENSGIHGDPGLQNPTAAIALINLQPGFSNLIEGVGDIRLLNSCPQDFGGNDRLNNSPCDLGAWSSSTNILTTDLVAPELEHNSLGNTPFLSSRKIFAQISDRNSGVNLGANRPRIYYKKNNGIWYNSPGNLVIGNSKNGNWEFLIDSAIIGGFAINDTIKYYLIAEDSSSNYNSIPQYADAINTTTVLNPPNNLFSYIITDAFPTLITIGPGGNYPNLTGLNGLFNSINNKFLQGNTTALLLGGSNILETGEIELNQWNEIKGTDFGDYGYTLTIRPSSSSQVLLSGNVSNTNGMIRLNGADRVLFLGYDTLGSSNDTNLIIRNISTSQPAISLMNDASNNYFEQVIFEGRNIGSQETDGGIVRLSAANLTTGSDNNKFYKCHFRRDISNNNFPGLPGVLFAGSTSTNANDNLEIKYCHFYNFNIIGILLGTGTGNNQIIKRNQFYQNLPYSFTSLAQTAIMLTSGFKSAGDSISDNIIGGSGPNLSGTWAFPSSAITTNFSAIEISTGFVHGIHITGNRIANIKCNWTSGNPFNGIYINSGSNISYIENNYLGDSLVPNNVSYSGNGGMIGINCYSSSTSIIKNNIIANFSNLHPNGAQAFVNGIRAFNCSSKLDISGNRILNLKDSSTYSLTASGASMIGIYVSALSNEISIEKNLIKGLSNNSISNSSSQVLGILSISGLNKIRENTIEMIKSSSRNGNTTTTAVLIGISLNSNVSNQFIEGNIIKNLSHTNPNPNPSQVIGILQTAGNNHSISKNSISQIRTNSTNILNAANSAIIGIIHTGNGGSIKFNQNTIQTLECSNNISNSIVGILYQGSGTSEIKSSIEKNFIHSFKLSGTLGGRIAGIQQISGIAGTFSNNMIRLGIDSNSNLYNNPYEVNGIRLESSGNFEFYHNSIYLGGNPNSGIAETSCLLINGSLSGTQLIDIRNNIFHNAISNSTNAFGKNYSIRLLGINETSQNIISNYNVLFAPGSGGFIAGTNTTNFQTLNGTSGWKRLTGFDLQSSSVNPMFINPIGSGNTIDLHLQNSNPVEGAGDSTIGVLITDDFDNNCRSCLSACDIGAHAGNFTISVDSFPPFISYTPLTNKSLISGPIQLLDVSISDNAGIPHYLSISGPKLYYKKGINGPYSFVSAFAQIGTSKSAKLNFQFQLNLVGGINIGDTIYYFVLAQDSLGNNIMSGQPLANATSVNNLIQGPQKPDYFVIVSQVTANKFYVGNNKQFPSLTGNGGLFEFLNNNFFQSNITAVISSNTIEPGTFDLKPIGTLSNSNFVLTIKPDSSIVNNPILISGSNPLGLIRFNGVDKVRISGISDLNSADTLRNLIFRNSANGPVFLLQNGVQQIKLENLVIEGQNMATETQLNNGLISFTGSNNSQGNSLDTITNCKIRNNSAQFFPPGIPNVLIGSYHLGTILNSDNVITKNELSNASLAYISIQVGSGNFWTVSQNNLFWTLPNTTQIKNPTGIIFNSGIQSSGHVISSNRIGGSQAFTLGNPWSLNNQVNWNMIQVSIGNIYKTTISNNLIRNIRLTNTFGANKWTGILVNNGYTDIINNMIGDTIQTGIIELSPDTKNACIEIASTVNAPVLINGNIIAGIKINNLFQTSGLIAILVKGGKPTITNNQIGGANQVQSLSSNSADIVRGIQIENGGNIDNVISISNNRISNLYNSNESSFSSVSGISIYTSLFVNINSNRISNLTSYSSYSQIHQFNSSVTGIGIGNGPSNGTIIKGNTIFNLIAANTNNVVNHASAITLGSCFETKVESNRIYNIQNLSSSNSTYPMATTNGISIIGIEGIHFVTNNQITLGFGINSGVQINGIWYQSTLPSQTFFYNNSVLIGGNSNTDLSSFAFHYGSNNQFESTSGVNLINNALINVRQGAGSKNYAISNERNFGVSGSGWFASDYNFLATTNINNVGLWGFTYVSFDAWKLFTNKDKFSYSENFNNSQASSLFVDPLNGNLNVNVNSPLSWYLNGKAIAGPMVGNLNVDYSGNPRGISAGYGIDIGSHEFTPNVVPPIIQISPISNTNGQSALVFAGRKLATIYWGSTGTLPSTLQFQYYSGQNPPSTIPATKFLNCYYNINAIGGNGYSYQISLNYDPALLGNVNNESSLRIARYASSTWNLHSSSVVNTITKTISSNNTVNGSAIFTATDFNSPLPVDLLSFEGMEQENDAILFWETSSEKNNLGFEIERSLNGLDFEKIGFVSGGMNSNQLRNYKFIDSSIFKQNSVIFYRLNQIDFDGSKNISKTIRIEKQSLDNREILIYPNPFTEYLTIKLKNFELGNCEMYLYDLNGEMIVSKEIFIETKNAEIRIDQIGNLSAGIYFLKVLQSDEILVQKLVRNP